MASGRSFHLQANSQLDKGHNDDALWSFSVAINSYVKAKKLDAVQRLLKIITKQVLPKLNKAQLTDGITNKLNLALDCASKIESNKLLDADIKELKKALAETKTREQ